MQSVSELLGDARTPVQSMSDLKYVNPLSQDADADADDAAGASSADTLKAGGLRAQLTTRTANGKIAVDSVGRKSALQPECLEAEDNLAPPPISQDLFESVTEAVENMVSRAARKDRFSANPKRDVFVRIVGQHLPQNAAGEPDWFAKLEQAKLGDMLTGQLGVSLGDDLAKLSKQAPSGEKLMEWWDTQSGISADTTDPFQIALKALEEGSMVSPTSNFRGNWDMAQAVFLVYIAVMLPYRLGFNDNVVLFSFWFWFDLMIDIYFAADLMLNFRTAVITKEGDILFTQTDIAKNYFRGWFSIDFVSCLPLSYAEYFMEKEEGGGSGNRAVRLLRLFRLLKLLRLVRIQRILQRWEEEMYGNRSIRIAKMIVLIGMASHWCACGWWFCGDGTDSKYDGWVQVAFGNETQLAAVDQSSKYFMSYFWSAMAVVKVGLADPDYRAGEPIEKSMVLVSFLMGTFITCAPTHCSVTSAACVLETPCTETARMFSDIAVLQPLSLVTYRI